MATIKQATAYTRQFLMVLSSDHISGATGKTVAVELGKNGATGVTAVGPVSEVDATNLPGWYKIVLNTTDTGTAGDLAYHCTATGCDPTDFVDQIQSQVFTDLQLNANGRALIADNIQQNTALNGFTFLMTSATTNGPLPGQPITAQRSLGGAGFTPCVNSVTELSNGVYTINLAASDLNAPVVMLRFTSPNCNDLDITIVTTP